jgi:hypothetical protein
VVTPVSVDIPVLMAVEVHKEMVMNVLAGQSMISSLADTMDEQAAPWHQQEGVRMCAVLSFSNCLLECVPSVAHRVEVGCA